MYTHELQLSAWNGRHRLGPTPSNAWAGFPAQSKEDEGCTLAYSIDEMALVLRLLIEGFGGEATSTALIKHTALEWRLMPGDDTTSRSWLGRILDELAGCEAITLEDMDEAEVIARIAPHGVALAVSYSPIFGQISG